MHTMQTTLTLAAMLCLSLVTIGSAATLSTNVEDLSLFVTPTAESRAANTDDVDFEAAAAGAEFSAISDVGPFQFAPCDVKQPTKDECIRNLFQQMLLKLKDGVPEYNMPSIDPYFYRRGIFRYANDGIQGGLLIKSMSIYGLSGMKVTNVQSNFTDSGFVMKLSIQVPKIKAGGHFKADVKFGGLRLVPKGPFNITIDNFRANILTDGTIEDTADGKRLQLRRLNANLAVGEAKVIANGIFSDRNLNAMILNLVNENLPEIVRVGLPATREQWAPILVTHVNEFFTNVPIEKFLTL